MRFTASLKFCVRRSRGKFWGAKLFARKNVRTKCENTWEWRENIFFDRTKFRENTWPEIPPHPGYYHSICASQHMYTPVGTIPCTPGRDENLPNPVGTFGVDRPGLSRSDKVFPTGTILVRAKKPDRVYFVSFPPILSTLPMPITRSSRASPT